MKGVLLLGLLLSVNCAVVNYVAVGMGNNSIAYSMDGSSWLGVDPGPTIFTSGFGVVYSGFLDLWIAVGQGTNTIAYSDDGINWTGQGVSFFNPYSFLYYRFSLTILSS